MPDTLVFPDSIAGRVDALSPVRPPGFVCSWTKNGLDAARVHVTGEMDIATAPRLERTLGEAQAQARLVVLDLRELAFMDCSGVHVIVTANIRARQAGRRLILVRGPTQVDRVLSLTGTSGELEIGDLDPGVPSVQVLLQFAEQQSLV